MRLTGCTSDYLARTSPEWRFLLHETWADTLTKVTVSEASDMKAT